MALTTEQRQAFNRAMNHPMLAEPIHGYLTILAGEQAGLATVMQDTRNTVEKLLEDIAERALSTPIQTPDVTDGWRQNFANAAGESLWDWDWSDKTTNTIQELKQLGILPALPRDVALALLNMFFALLMNLTQFLRMEVVGLDPELLRMTPEETEASRRALQSGKPLFLG